MSMEERDGESIICPYCKSNFGDMWEVKENDGIEECEECGKKFSWRRRIEVEYISTCDCEDNNDSHEYDYQDNWIKNDEEPNQEFRICHCKKCSEYKVEKRDIKGE